MRLMVSSPKKICQTIISNKDIGENEHESSQNSEHYLDDMSWEGAPVACLIAPTTLNTDVDLSQPGVADSFDSYCIFNSDDGDAGWEGAPVAYLIAVTEFDVDVDLSEPGAGDAFDSYTLV